MTINETEWHETYYARKKQLSEEKILERRALNRKWNLHKREEIKADTGARIVRVEYPESTLPDWYSLAEYKRRRYEFANDAEIYIDGIKQEKQDNLF